VSSEVAVTGEVLVKQLPGESLRTVLIGHEEGASVRANGTFRSLSPRVGVPVAVVPPRP
jgi:hypothetical protein